ncbi:MAG: ZIP family metal transporter [Gemmatimonadaceae bacterium]
MTLQTVALYAALAAAAAGLGPILSRVQGPEDRFVGLANALAAGMMLGLAYPLTREGFDLETVQATVGAAVAVVALFLVHVWFNLDGGPSLPPLRALIGASIHSAPEGLALGVAAAVDPRFGVVVALTLALHNVGEGIALSSYLVRREKRVRAVAAAALSNLPQFAMAAGGFALASAHPGLRPSLLGAAAGSLVYLSLADLLPSGYRGTGRTAISIVVIAATSMVAFAEAMR